MARIKTTCRLTIGQWEYINPTVITQDTQPTTGGYVVVKVGKHFEIERYSGQPIVSVVKMIQAA